MIETYLLLLTDSFFAFLILPIKTDMVYEAMMVFTPHDKNLISIIALIGSFFALSCNYYLGKSLIFLKKSDFFKNSEESLSKVEKFWNKYLIWALPILALNSFGIIFSLFCGFFRSRPWLVFMLLFLGRAGFYLYQNINL